MKLDEHTPQKNKLTSLDNHQGWVANNTFDWVAFIAITLVILLAFILF